MDRAEIVKRFEGWLAHPETSEIEHPGTIEAVKAAVALLATPTAQGPSLAEMAEALRWMTDERAGIASCVTEARAVLARYDKAKEGAT